ncbi:MAG: nSTAND1 domain-containing NTPase [Gammaproteobacteria bacterium]
MVSTKKSDVFLSFNWHDHKQVLSLADKLKTQNLHVFAEPWYVRPGGPWPEVLDRVIAASGAVVICAGSRDMGSWQHREINAALERKKINPSFPVVTALLPGCSEPPLGLLSLNIWIDFRQGLDQSMAMTLLAAVIRRRPLAPDLLQRIKETRGGINPFKGLHYFREEDASFFYGRHEAVKRLENVLQENTFVAVTGVSGSGKSSLVRAGLIPKLRSDAGGHWEILTIFPGESPLFNLTSAFMALLFPHLYEGERLQKTVEHCQALVKEPGLMKDWVKAIRKNYPGSSRCLLVVDQWEELYALRQGESENQGENASHHFNAVTVFIDALLAAADSKEISVVLTIRSDFIGKAISYRPLADRLQHAQVYLGPMEREELRLAIEKPAENIGSGFEKGLPEILLNDTGNANPARLPLLAFALHRLWDDPERRGGKLRLSAYAAMGGVSNTLANTADSLYGNFTGDEKKIAQRIMAQLVQVGEGFDDMRRRVKVSRLGADASGIIERLADKKLVAVAHAPGHDQDVAELTHEAVIKQWKLYKDWLYDDLQFATWRTQLQFARERQEILVKHRLGEACHWRKVRSKLLSKEERDFIDRSRRWHFFRKVKIAASILLPLTLMGAFATWVGTEPLLTPKRAVQVLLVKAGITFFLKPAMVQIPPEEEAEQVNRFSFKMGSTAADKDSDFTEYPQHTVVIEKPFNLGRYEVTFDEYLIFAYLIENEGGCPGNHTIEASRVLDENWGQGTRPAINVSWSDAHCYAEWLSKKTGSEIPYRLPSEAEWEFAARAGTQTRFWWGSGIKEKIAVCDGCLSEWSGKSEKKHTAATDDSSFEPNPWGLYHVSGNTWEWVEDCWHENYIGAPGDGSPWNSDNNGNCGRHVLRGGSWVDTPVGLRSAHRYKLNTDYRYYNVGFRLARD